MTEKMDTATLESKMFSIVDGYWAVGLPKSQSAMRTANWADPVTVEKVLEKVRGEIERSITRIVNLRELENELIWRKKELSEDGCLFFDDVPPLELWRMYYDDPLEDALFESGVVQQEREIVAEVIKQLPVLVKALVDHKIKEFITK